MPGLSRRELFLGAMPAAAALAASSRDGSGAATRRARMVVGCQRAPTDERALMFFKRHAVDHVCGYPPRGDSRESWSAEALSRLRERCESHGVALDMVEFPFLGSNPITPTARKAIMLGRELDRQREVDEVCEIIRNCARAGIPAAKYNLNLLGVLRTAPTAGRGGSRYSTWRLSEAPQLPPLTEAGHVPEDVAWERISWFLERVVPVAGEHRVRLACHPHDPGVPPSGFRGVARVLGTVEGLRRFVSIQESPYHGLNFCLGTVSEMLQDPGREVYDVVREFGARGKIFNFHFRNIRGQRDAFQEVYPDEGEVDMVRVMTVLKDVGYGYMVMPDHMPTHADDPGGHQAFAFGYGYIKAMIQAVDALA